MGAGLEVLPCSEKKSVNVHPEKREFASLLFDRCSLGLHGHGICLELLSEPDELAVPPPHAGHLLGKTHAGGLDQITVT